MCIGSEASGRRSGAWLSPCGVMSRLGSLIKVRGHTSDPILPSLPHLPTSSPFVIFLQILSMSQLLQTILSAKLASASIDDNREAHNDDWEEIHTSDEELVGK